MGPHLEGDPLRHNDNWLEGRRNQAAQFVRPSNRTRNSIRFSSNESLPHLLLKSHICYQLAGEGKDFITEAIFENSGGRADILILDDHIIIECLETETEDQVRSKAATYPNIFAIEFAKWNGEGIERGLVRR
jgi:hypothetical protein